jgi:esterase/lipase
MLESKHRKIILGFISQLRKEGPPALDTEAPPDYTFDLPSIDRTVRYMTRLQRALALNIRVHRPHGQIEDGDIYLFNHFARFETFIPQYLIYKQTGVLSRSVASSEFFVNQRMGRYLRGVGAVPNDHPHLLPFLAAEILRGRKVVIFPEGGMVKDRRVMGDDGEFSIYSRTADRRRKHHSGAAVLAQVTDSFKCALLALQQSGESLSRWAASLEMSETELIAAAQLTTRLVPGNITFYPLRVDESAVYRVTESLAKLNPRAAEELLIESNILLRNTDMDLRLGASILPNREPVDELLRMIKDSSSIEEFFAIAHDPLHDQIAELRDRSMPAIYREVTINLSHLASTLMSHALKWGVHEMPQTRFHKALFLAIKSLQEKQDVHLHRGLTSPERYAGLIEGSCAGFHDFIQMAEQTHALTREPASYHFTDKLLSELQLDLVRRENPVRVYCNESEPMPQVLEAAQSGFSQAGEISEQELAKLLFAEEQAALRWARQHYSHAHFAEINNQETASASPEPYWLTPAMPRKIGVVLVHGLLASPAELREFGDQIAALNFPVLGVRLQGHGTSPWDLKETRWQDWLASVKRGIRIMAPFVDQICLVGFSTGSALSLLAAAAHPGKVMAVAACSTPFKMRNRNLIVVPLVHSANEIVRRLSDREGLIMFRRNQSEHPDINYFNIPVSALNELRHMIDALDEKLPLISVPTLILQGSNDHVVDSASAEIIKEKLTAAPWSRVVMIESDRHGILNEDIGDSRGAILRFLESLDID